MKQTGALFDHATPVAEISRRISPLPRVIQKSLRGPFPWLVPSIVVLLLVTLYPLVQSLVNSFRFYNLNVASDAGNFLGISNYVQAFTTGGFGHALLLSFVFAAVATGIEVVLGFGIALLLNLEIRGARSIRSLLILPIAVAPAVTGLAFRSLYDPETGAVPYILAGLGINPPAAGILGDSSTALLGLIATDAWEWTPFAALVLLAAMQGIPRDVLEAASVDGANSSRTLFSIILPLIRPIFVVVILLRFIAIFNIFDIVYVETRGGPGFSTTVTGISIYQNALSSYNIGYASALTWIITIIVGVLICIYLATVRGMAR